MKKYLFIIICLAILSACNPCKRLTRLCPPKIHDSLIYIETIETDTNYTIPDSVYWQFVLECYSNYNVILKAFNETNTGIDTKIIIRDSIVYIKDKQAQKRFILTISAYTDSIASLNRTIAKLRSEVKTVTVKVPEPYSKTPRWIKIIVAIFFIENLLIIFLVVRKFKNKLMFWKK